MKKKPQILLLWVLLVSDIFLFLLGIYALWQRRLVGLAIVMVAIGFGYRLYRLALMNKIR